MNPLRMLRFAAHHLALLFFPRYCPVCGRRLQENEELLCINCNEQLPRTKYKGHKDNPTELQLASLGPALQRASAYMFYTHGSAYSHLFFQFKYHNRPDVAVALGRVLALDLTDTPFFTGVDVIVPVPISRKRRRQRGGYNQSEKLAEGIAAITHLPINTTAVIRKHFFRSQTQLTEKERAANVAGAFTLAHPEELAGKHVLLVDDIITYGHTIKACAKAILQADGVRISVLTLGTSYHRLDSTPPKPLHPWEVMEEA